MTCYVITIKVMRSYYKGECTLDSLSVANFCANGAVFNWCSYLLEELLVTCEEVQEKGGTFTYKYILLDFSMLKWRPPMRRQLEPVDKGCLTNIFEPWHAREDSKNMEFNNVAFLKWYNHLIDSTQRMRIPHEILNFHTRNISFSLNRHYTFVFPRHAKPS
jgi:hypothetical protein